MCVVSYVFCFVGVVTRFSLLILQCPQRKKAQRKFGFGPGLVPVEFVLGCTGYHFVLPFLCVTLMVWYQVPYHTMMVVSFVSHHTLTVVGVDATGKVIPAFLGMIVEQTR